MPIPAEGSTIASASGDGESVCVDGNQCANCNALRKPSASFRVKVEGVVKAANHNAMGVYGFALRVEAADVTNDSPSGGSAAVSAWGVHRSLHAFREFHAQITSAFPTLATQLISFPSLPPTPPAFFLQPECVETLSRVAKAIEAWLNSVLSKRPLLLSPLTGAFLAPSLDTLLRPLQAMRLQLVAARTQLSSQQRTADFATRACEELSKESAMRMQEMTALRERFEKAQKREAKTFAELTAVRTDRDAMALEVVNSWLENARLVAQSRKSNQDPNRLLDDLAAHIKSQQQLLAEQSQCTAELRAQLVEQRAALACAQAEALDLRERLENRDLECTLAGAAAGQARVAASDFSLRQLWSRLEMHSKSNFSRNSNASVGLKNTKEGQETLKLSKLRDYF
jgi:hypothetical protein